MSAPSIRFDTFGFKKNGRVRGLKNLGKRRKMLLLWWESNHTFPTCRALLLDYRAAYLYFAYPAIIVPPQYPPSDIVRVVVLGCEGNRCWRHPCVSNVCCANPGGAADAEHCRHRAVAEGCCMRVACRCSPICVREKNVTTLMGIERHLSHLPGGCFTTRLQSGFTLLCLPNYYCAAR